ncbi:unnamed protein product, partial [Closterium sp. NIES-53]
GVPLSPFSHLLLLLLLSTSLALRRSGLRLLLVGGAATARARGARVVEGAVGAAVEAVEEAGGGGGGRGGGGSGGFGGGGGGGGGSGSGGGGSGSGGGGGGGGGAGRSGAAQRGDFGGSQRQQQPRSRETPADGDCYLCVPPDPSIEAASLGASGSAAPGSGESSLSGNAPTESLHTFTLDSGASRSFFRDSTTLTPLSRPVVLSLADPSESPVLAHSSTVLPCPAAPSGLLWRLHLPSFSTNLVFSTASRSSPASAPCSCRPLTHETLLWHHRLGHPSLPRLRGMASCTLVSGLPRSLPPLPPGPAPTCVPCVEGRQRAAPHSSEFPPTEAPLQTLHMDVWGPAHIRGQGHECYFLLVVDDYSRYTTVFPLRSK